MAFVTMVFSLLNNPLSILPNSLKKQQAKKNKTNHNSREVFNGPVICWKELAILPNTTPYPLRPFSQLEEQWVIQSLNCSPNIQKPDFYICFLSSRKIPKEHIFHRIYSSHAKMTQNKCVRPSIELLVTSH